MNLPMENLPPSRAAVEDGTAMRSMLWELATRAGRKVKRALDVLGRFQETPIERVLALSPAQWNARERRRKRMRELIDRCQFKRDLCREMAYLLDPTMSPDF